MLRSIRLRLLSLWPLGLALLVAGCLPSSCSRDELRDLTPADSLSRAFARTLPVDTLALAWTSTGPADATLEYPRTALFLPDGRLLVSDAQANRIVAWTGPDDARALGLDGLAVPYLAGAQGDTVFVYNPPEARLDHVVGEAVVARTPMPRDGLARDRVHYAGAGPGGLYYKVVGEDIDGYLARVAPDGALLARTPLPGPHWRWAGLLRAWGDSLLSLSGFRPLVDVAVPGAGDAALALDSLALFGFDSPMLARSRGFLAGQVDEAPLLSAAAAPAGELLFVLNMRPGWLRVDAFGRDGRLRHQLVEPDPGFRKDFFPTDLAARRLPDGTYELAVVATRPEPSVTVYRWRPE